MSPVISASRRTDIPGFFSEWLVNRLRAGYVYVRQPYNGIISRVSLEPRDVSAIFFCSKNYRPLLPRLEAVERTTRNLFFHFTITANREMELSTPDYRDAIGDYIHIARRYSPEHILWRYDPICVTDKISFDMCEERFVRCAELLRGRVARCIISFVYPYKKVLKNFKNYTDHTLAELPLERKREYARRLAARAAGFGIRLFACCNDYLVSDSVEKASCIDGGYMSRLFSAEIDLRKAATRKECGCTRSIDIGAYDTCSHGCIYCYANVDKERARKNQERQDPEWNALGMHVDEDKFEAPNTNSETPFECPALPLTFDR